MLPLIIPNGTMNRVVIESCPLCGHPDFEQLMSCTDYYKSGEQFDIYSCKHCGFRFTQAFPVASEIGVYYEAPSYISHTDTHKGLMNGIYHRVRSYMLRRKAKLVEQQCGKKQGRLLDVGAGTGYFATTMQQRGWQVDAIEKSADARSAGNTLFGLQMMPDEALFTQPIATYDVITLWHVLEHIEPLKQSCEQLKKLLKPDGILVVALPNCSSYDAKHYGKEWAAYNVPRHLWHFTPTTLATLASAMGFAVKEMKPMPFDAFYVAMLSEKNRGKKCAFVRGVWLGMRAWIAALGNRERSSSVIYTMKRENNL